MFKKISMQAAAAVLAMGTAASAAPIFFDDFNNETLGAPQGTLTNWTVTQGTVDVIGATAFYDFYPGNGRYLDMNGSPGQGRIETGSLGLTGPKRYELSFNYGNNAFSNGVEELTFGIGDQLFSLVISGATAWTQYVVSFVYDGGGDDYLVFADTGTQSPNDNGGPILDNVQLSAVPVPAAGLLLIGALGGLAALRRRKTA